MSKVKKLLAIILSMVMILGMSVMTFAAEGTTSTPISGTPSENDTATVTVQGVEAGATIKAYQITKATYNENNVVGFSGYKSVPLVTTGDSPATLTVANKLQPTAEEITSIANAIADGSLEVTPVSNWTRDDDSGNYTAELAAGYWIIIVENTNTTIYNPMLAGVYYANADGSNNTLEGGKVSADESLVIGTSPVYAKSTNAPELTKQIDTTDENKKGNDLAVGDTVSFVLTTTIPDYSDAYKNVVFYITDELSDGLTFILESFKLDNSDLPNGVTVDYVTEEGETEPNQQKVKINFTDTYVKENGNKQIKITYTARLTSSAGVNFDANTNTATLTYTNKPGEVTDGTPAKTYHYTFALDGMLNGQNGVNTIQTSEIIKVDENGNVQNVIDKENKTSATVTGALGGATFQLYQKDEEGNIIQNSIKTDTSDDSGYFDFSGLDAGIYYLKETAAPQGYQLDATERKVVISAIYNENGTLDSYTVTIGNNRTSTYKATYEGETITNIDSTVQTTVIKNTTLSSLPSTGGIGTTIFTIGGCVIMIAAAGLYFASRRRQENK